MQSSSCLYPIPIESAVALAKQINLSELFTHIEPSRFSGFLFENVSAVALIKMMFEDVRHWPTTDNDLFLVYVERSPEVLDWIKSCPYEYEAVEIVAIQFASGEDQESFENAIWPEKRTSRRGDEVIIE